MRILKTALAFILALAATLPAIGCGPENIRQIDPTKVQLYVACYEGGVGKEWLEKTIERFEQAYAEEHFTEDTTGVQVFYDYDKKYAETAFIENIKNSEYSVIFTEQCYFNDFVAKDVLLDISDVVTGTLSDITEGKETGSIEDKLNAEQKAAFKALKGGYYVLPHYEVFGGLTYDEDLFESKNFYIARTSDDADNYGCIANKYGERSLGPDGIEGTSDDGLPATYDEFFGMCDKMVANGVTPFYWTGMYQDYVNMLALALYSGEEGAESYKYNFTFDSNGNEMKYYAENGGNLTEESAIINNENAYLLKQQTGKYKALTFLKRMMSNDGYYSTNCFSTAVSHLDAQEQYIKSTTTRRPYAMLVEGTYWYNEAQASSAFDRMVSQRGEAYSAANRNFKWMPLPRYERAEQGEYKSIAVDRNYSYAYVNGNIKGNALKERLSKLFMQFCYTDESLLEFTELTGICKGVKYDMSAADKAAMRENLNPYYKSIWDYRENATVLYPVSNSKILMNNQSELSVIKADWAVNVGDTAYNNPISAFKKNGSLTALDYFKAGFISGTEWRNRYGADFT